MATGADLGAQADLNLHGKVLYGANRNYDNLISYTEGDIVIFNSHLYVAGSAPIVVGVEPDVSGWTLISGTSSSNQTIEVQDDTAQILAPNANNIVFDFGDNLTAASTGSPGSPVVTIDAEIGAESIRRMFDADPTTWVDQMDGTLMATIPHGQSLSSSNVAIADVLWYDEATNNIAIPVETTVTTDNVIGVINAVGEGAFAGHFVLLLSGGISSAGTTTTIATRFDRSFTDAEDIDNWIIPMGGTDPEITILATIHGIGTSPIVQVAEVIDPTDPNSASTVTLMPIRISQNGDVVLVVDPGTTFNGNVTIL